MRYYLDTEFNGYGGELISLALAREDAASIYCVSRVTGEPYDPWVLKNVAPLIGDVPSWIDWEEETPESMAYHIAEFLQGDPNPIIVCDWPADIRYFCGVIEFPGGNMAPIPGLTVEMHRVDAYPTTLKGAVQHNAWWDAMALREKLSDHPHQQG